MTATPLPADQVAAIVAEVAARKAEKRPGTTPEDLLDDVGETVRLALEAYDPPTILGRLRRVEVSLWKVILFYAVLIGCMHGLGQAAEFLGIVTAMLAVTWACLRWLCRW